MSKQEIETCQTELVHSENVERVRGKLPDEDTAFDLAELFKVFGDSTRTRILSCLEIQELCVCDIAACLRMTNSAVSHQLRILKAAKLVKPRRDGKTVFYSLADDHVLKIFECALEHISEED